MRMRPLMVELYLLTARSLKVTLREPWALIPNVAISLFFLFVYNAGLSGIGQLRAFGGMPYLSFVFPVALVSGSVGGAGAAGQSLIRDLESRYFTKLRLTPVSRLVLVAAPMLSGMLQLVAQSVLILGVGLALGLRVPGGLAGAVELILIAAGWGLGFSGYAVAVALRSQSSRTAQAATFVFFPLLFLSDTFVPMSLIRSGWLKVAARLNPTTYVFNAMRALLATHGEASQVVAGLVAILVVVAVTMTLAVYTARSSLRNA